MAMNHKFYISLDKGGRGGGGGGRNGVRKGSSFCGTPTKKIAKSAARGFQSYDSAAAASSR